MKSFDISRAEFLLQDSMASQSALKESLKEAVDFVKQFQRPLAIEGGWVSLDERGFVQFRYLYNQVVEVRVRPELWWYMPEVDDLGIVRFRLTEDDLEKMLMALGSTLV